MGVTNIKRHYQDGTAKGNCQFKQHIQQDPVNNEWTFIHSLNIWKKALRKNKTRNIHPYPTRWSVKYDKPALIRNNNLIKP